MIAQGYGIILQRIERRDHRMRPAATALRRQIRQGRALQEIAIVQQDRPRHLGPRRRNQTGRLRQPLAEQRPVAGVIIGQKLGMQVTGRHQSQGHRGVRVRGQTGLKSLSPRHMRPRPCGQSTERYSTTQVGFPKTLLPLEPFHKTDNENKHSLSGKL